MAIAVANGSPALGHVKVEEGDVLYLALDDSPKRLLERIAMLLAGTTAPNRLDLARQWLRADKGGTEALEGWLKAHPAARMVVLDTIARFRARRSERGYAAATRAWSRF